MNKNINKSIILTIIVFMTISFTGCLNLASKIEEEEQQQASVNNHHQGVFKSIDQGETWEHKVDVADGNFIDGIKIQSMKIDPQDHELLYLGTVANGLYKSSDGAQTWEKVVDENGILKPKATIYDIAIEKGNSDIIYLATLNKDRGELLKSEDGGKSWTNPYLISKLNKPVYTVEIDPKNQNIVYIGTAEAGFHKSEDKAENWERVTWFGKDIKVKDILIDFHNSDGIILWLSNDIVKSVDRGETWESLKKNIRDARGGIKVFSKISSVTMHPTNPLVIYITYLNIVVVSHDGGNTWEILNTITPERVAGKSPHIKQIGLIGDIVYYGAGNVLYKSENAGLTWSSHDIPIKGDVRYTISDYTNPDIIYIGSFYDPPPEPSK